MSRQDAGSVPHYRILVVDDDPISRRHVCAILSPPHECIEATNQSEALEQYRTHRPDCVLLDYRLPGVVGLSLLTELVELGAVVVMMTGRSELEFGAEALKLGAQDHLEKGTLTEERLARALRYAVER